MTPDYGDTARVAEREGLWCYDHWALDGINLGSVPSEDVLALVTFQATDAELPAILGALSAHGYGQNQWPGRNLTEFKDIAWGATLRRMKRAATIVRLTTGERSPHLRKPLALGPENMQPDDLH